MPNIKTHLRASRDNEINSMLENSIESLKEEGLSVEFGKIGLRTTYALIYNESHEKEIVGYTFIRDIARYRENIGQLKALQQALARKEIAEKEDK